MAARTAKVLVIGAAGQIGSDLTPALRERHGAEAVIAGCREARPVAVVAEGGPSEFFDAADTDSLRAVIERHGVSSIYHLAAIMSGEGEQNPELAWRVNMESLKNVLDLAVAYEMDQVFFPSSIAVFGPTTPQQETPQRTVLEPTTIYGVTKLAGENLCHYYALRYGLDVRSLRYPGLVTYKTFSGGGTTDYAVEIFIEAVKAGRYTCFVKPETTLPLMYMDDAVKAALTLMAAPAERISVRTSYNLGALSFTAAELAAEVASQVAGFTCEYAPDFRQAIADSWPDSVDDSTARNDWGWSPDYDLRMLAETMLRGIREANAAA